MKLPILFAAWLCLSLAAGAEAAIAQEDSQIPVEKMAAAVPEWVFVGSANNGTTVVNTQTGKMQGSLNTGHSADLGFDPAGKHYYVSETIWSLGNRGVRQDMITVYDSTNLKVQAEIKMPGRMLVGGRTHNFLVSDDGKTAYVYNLDPASTVNVIDLAHGKFVKTIDLAGCATLIPNGPAGFSALCSDGSMATVDAAHSTITHTDPFFSATDDPIFDNYSYNPATKTAVFISYTGLITTAQMGSKPVISAPFSLQGAAGFRPAAAKPLDLAYYPGNNQPTAWHFASNRLFVLVHAGEYWSHIAPGTQLWVVDLAAKKVVKRIPLKDPVSRVAVTQGAHPVLYLTSGANGILMNPDTGEELHRDAHWGSGVVQTIADSY